MSSAYALELRDLRKSFGKTEIIRGVNLAVTAGRAGGHHRPQRRRQVDAVQPDQRPLRPRPVASAAQGQRINGMKPFEINRLGLSRSFQITNIFPKLSVFENLRCAVLWSLGYKYTFWRSWPAWRTPTSAPSRCWR
jgi:branched-chain amino acid transport system ATP-binding protein